MTGAQPGAGICCAGGGYGFTPIALPPLNAGSALANDLHAMLLFVDRLIEQTPNADDGRMRCPLCRRRPLPNANDVANGYCPHCHWWTRDPMQAAIRLTQAWDAGLRGDESARRRVLHVDPYLPPGVIEADGKLWAAFDLSPLQWAWVAGVVRAEELDAIRIHRT